MPLLQCLHSQSGLFRGRLGTVAGRLGLLYASLSLLIVVFWLAGISSASSKHTLTPAQRNIRNAWLAQHPQFRMTTDADCDCASDIQQMRAGYGGKWKAIPDYHPYVATGDFNGDGISDFAVAVIDRSKTTNSFTLLVFNGPFESKSILPAFIKESLDLKHQGLFYGAPRPRPYRLVLGRFEADMGLILVPHGHNYTLE
jgi:hypothetical protein